MSRMNEILFDGNMKPNLPPILFGTLPTHPMLQPRPNRVEPENAVAEQVWKEG